MTLLQPAQFFATTLCDRHQPQQLSFVFIPARSLADESVPELAAVKDLIEPNAASLRAIAPSYLPAALASLLSSPASPDPFWWVDKLPGGYISLQPNTAASAESIGFAEYVAFSELLPFEESPLRSKSLMSVAVAAGAKIGLIAGGPTPLVLLTVPAGIILCTAAVIFGPALGEKISRLIA